MRALTGELLPQHGIGAFAGILCIRGSRCSRSRCPNSARNRSLSFPWETTICCCCSCTPSASVPRSRPSRLRAECGAHLEVCLPVAELIDRQQAAIPGAEEWNENGRDTVLDQVPAPVFLAGLDAATRPKPNGDYPALRIRRRRPRSIERALKASDRGAEISCVVECPECSSSSSRT